MPEGVMVVSDLQVGLACVWYLVIIGFLLFESVAIKRGMRK